MSPPAFTRAQLGLPPEKGRIFGASPFAWLAAAVLTLALPVLAGVGAGKIAYRRAETRFVRLADALAQLPPDRPEPIRAALRDLQARRAALAKSPTARIALAEALATAAGRLPEAAWPYWQDARQELRAARRLLGPPPAPAPTATSGIPVSAGSARSAPRPGGTPAAVLRAPSDTPPDAADVGAEDDEKKEEEGAPPPAAAPSRDDQAAPERAALGWVAERFYSWTLQELGEDAAALASMDRADAWEQALPPEGRAERLRAMMNDRAYLLATARDPSVRDPAGALRLAKAMLIPPPGAAPEDVHAGQSGAGTSTPPADPSADLSAVPPRVRPAPAPETETAASAAAPGAEAYATASAALVDTLAATYWATDEAALARRTQRMALGLADETELSVYMKRYREITAAPPPTAP